jgi:hypothetical protein
VALIWASAKVMSSTLKYRPALKRLELGSFPLAVPPCSVAEDEVDAEATPGASAAEVA